MSIRKLLSVGVCVAMITGCGYSEDEWQAQLAKYQQLAQKDKATESERARTQAELDKAQKDVADLKDQLQKMGVNLDTINQQLAQTGTVNQQLAKNVEELQRALKEYQERAAQLERIKARFELLRDKLKKLTELGLKVEIRRNRMVIRLPGDVLFASGDDKLSKEGDKVLDAVADVIRSNSLGATFRWPATPTTSRSRVDASATIGVCPRCARAKCCCTWSRPSTRRKGAAVSPPIACTSPATATPIPSPRTTSTMVASKTAA